tara:strand:+ start:102 stop:524 length:423 start_codon:yes stop_codon:yes gene_type:complete
MIRTFFFFIFQLFFLINSSYSDHLLVKVSGFVNASSPIYVWGYDRKFYFEENSAPLFIVGERDINKFNQINLRAFPHIIVGLFVFQDVDSNGEFTLDFKGDPIEPYGFSLNPAKNFQDIFFEDFAFDMNIFSEIEIELKK